ncbi:MFS transporter [Paraburkholderia sp. ZP32-5]|uniref:MFS transporter n=1 Tax=Paraburkholderia sp. ZP32-5 TaxID=2883245 RepID=UPI001F2F235F|nr:MFS transporter [Paraburkholderia sp. ZP32-5]
MEGATLLADVGAVRNIENRAYAKTGWRIIPVLLICGLLAYLDRVNVGFAKLQMLDSLGFNETVYGLGAGIFFIGYFIFEVPSNLILYRVGPRRWIARIAITWGLLSVAMMFVRTPLAFYVLRFLLGAAEAGFYPGMILYLTYWYPAQRRGKVMAIFLTSVPISGIVGGPLSGWVMHSLSGVHGLGGWQWLFLVEGIPSVLMGIVVLFVLKDSVAQADWLTSEEKNILTANVEADGKQKEHVSFAAALRNARIWLLCITYFCIMMGVTAMIFWMPSIINASGVKDPLQIGIYSAIPYLCAVIGMIGFGISSDRLHERRWHVAIPCALGAIGLIASTTLSANLVMTVISLSLAITGVLSALTMFWGCPTAIFKGVAAAGGIALINSVGNLAGFVSPYMIGYIKDATASTNIGVAVVAAFLAFGSLLIFAAAPARLVNR